jgi:hypothetical protein
MKNFSFLNTIVLVNGIEVSEWAPGEDALNLRRREDSFRDVVGNSGDMAVFPTADLSGEFDIGLLQTSTSNKYFSSLLAAAEVGAFVPVFVQYKDLGGNDLASGTSGYIKKWPEAPRGAGIATQRWLIVVERLDLLLGGSELV